MHLSSALVRHLGLALLPALVPLMSLRAQSRAERSDPALEVLLGAPFPSGVVAAHASVGRAAWVSLERGRRSVYVADFGGPRSEARIPRTPARRVAHFTSDDGQDVGGIVFSRDGSSVAFVRGQGYNAQRENPNPTSDPRGGEQAVWVSLSGANARRIGRGWNPTLSPDGRRVAYQLDSTIMIAATTGVATPRPLFRGRGLNTDPRWSPDGRFVAFTSQRGAHAFVGAYEVARDTIRWMAPGVDRDGSPRWSADGKRLAFIRVPGGSTGGNVFAPEPGRGFSIWVADPVTGDGRQLWQSPPGVEGRLRAPTAGESFLWSGERLVFFLERDGWQHLYSIGADGREREPLQLTKGECEVEEPSPGPTGSFVYYSSNCGDIDRKHIWRVASGLTRDATSGPEQLTIGTTIDYAPAVSGAHILFLQSDARRPPRPMVALITPPAARLDASPMPGAPALPPGFPLDALVAPQPVTFQATDGTEIHGQLFVPPGARNAPALIFTHGGPMRQMLLGWHPRGYYNRAYAMNQYLAGKGYVVLSVNYRGGVGYGRAFREAPNRGRSGASEYQDVVAGGRFLQSHPAVDSTRIGLWGGSYGGFLTALGMARDPALFKAGVDLHGVHDWNARFSNFAPSATEQRVADSVLARGRESSPICCVRDIRGPILFIHGDDDRNVAFSETVNLVQLMRREGKPFELIVFPDEVHDFLRYSSWLRAYRATADFFDRVLVRRERIATAQEGKQ